MSPYQMLANAIIEQAATDHKSAAEFLCLHPRTEELVETVAAQLAEKELKRKRRAARHLPPERRRKSREESRLDAIIENERLLADAESFFLSDWFTDLTDLDGTWLLEQLRKMEDEQYGCKKVS